MIMSFEHANYALLCQGTYGRRRRLFRFNLKYDDRDEVFYMCVSPLTASGDASSPRTVLSSRWAEGATRLESTADTLIRRHIEPPSTVNGDSNEISSFLGGAMGSPNLLFKYTVHAMPSWSDKKPDVIVTTLGGLVKFAPAVAYQTGETPWNHLVQTIFACLVCSCEIMLNLILILKWVCWCVQSDRISKANECEWQLSELTRVGLRGINCAMYRSGPLMWHGPYTTHPSAMGK